MGELADLYLSGQFVGTQEQARAFFEWLHDELPEEFVDCWQGGLMGPENAADEVDALRVRVAELEEALRISKQETERAHLARIESQNPGIDMDRVKRERRYLLDAEWHYCVDLLFGWLAYESPFAAAARSAMEGEKP